MSRSTRFQVVAKITAAGVAAAAFVLAPLVTTAVAVADGDQDPGTSQTPPLPPVPPKDNPDGHIWID